MSLYGTDGQFSGGLLNPNAFGFSNGGDYMSAYSPYHYAPPFQLSSGTGSLLSGATQFGTLPSGADPQAQIRAAMPGIREQQAKGFAAAGNRFGGSGMLGSGYSTALGQQARNSSNDIANLYMGYYSQAAENAANRGTQTRLAEMSNSLQSGLTQADWERQDYLNKLQSGYWGQSGADTSGAANAAKQAYSAQIAAASGGGYGGGGYGGGGGYSGSNSTPNPYGSDATSRWNQEQYMLGRSDTQAAIQRQQQQTDQERQYQEYMRNTPQTYYAGRSTNGYGNNGAVSTVYPNYMGGGGGVAGVDPTAPYGRDYGGNPLQAPIQDPYATQQNDLYEQKVRSLQQGQKQEWQNQQVQQNWQNQLNAKLGREQGAISDYGASLQGPGQGQGQDSQARVQQYMATIGSTRSPQQQWQDIQQLMRGGTVSRESSPYDQFWQQHKEQQYQTQQAHGEQAYQQQQQQDQYNRGLGYQQQQTDLQHGEQQYQAQQQHGEQTYQQQQQRSDQQYQQQYQQTLTDLQRARQLQDWQRVAQLQKYLHDTYGVNP